MGWSLEMALPWKVLGEFANRPTPPEDGDQWRINFSRVEWDIEIIAEKYHKLPNRPEHNWVWSPQGVVDMHRPEMWGYLQFSTARPGKATYHPDPAIPVRVLLMQLYYAQRDHQKKTGAWALRWEDLGLPFTPSKAIPHPPTIERKAQGYVASCLLQLSGTTSQRWHVEQDSRIWHDL